jgi:hypothetical protein
MPVNNNTNVNPNFMPNPNPNPNFPINPNFSPNPNSPPNPNFNPNFSPDFNGNANPNYGPEFNGNPNFDNDGETFFEIGSPLNPPQSRIKREIVFPDDETTNEIEDKIEEVGGGNSSVQAVETIDGRALKQTMQSVTKIDVGVQSQLVVAPGSTSVIYFDVTNLRNEPTYHTFNVQDEKRFLRSMEPRA